MHILVRLSYMELFLILWLAEQVDEDNRVNTEKETRTKFIHFMTKITRFDEEKKIVYKDGSIRTSISNLIRHKLLIREPLRRGKCWVNPEFFFRGSPRKRVNMLNYIKSKHYDAGIFI